MFQPAAVNRRAFLRNGGIAALVGAVGPGRALAEASPGAAPAAANGRFDFDTVYDRVGTGCVKWDEQLAKYGKDSVAVGMGIADMDFRAAPVITQALADRLRHENWGYLSKPGNFVNEAVIAWNKRRYGVEIKPESLAVTTGVHPGLLAALRAFSPPGSKVLLQTPTYNGFYSDIANARCVPEESPMRLVDGRYAMDFDDLERRISHDTNTLILCNPQNPTGNCWSAEDLTRLGEICTRRRVVVLADEIHCDFVAKGCRYTPYASLKNKDIVRNSVTFKAASKSFGLAAMRCGWYHSDNPDYLARVKENDHPDLTTLGLIASQAAYTGGEDWLDQCVDYIDGNLEHTARFVAAELPLVKFVKPQGTYLAWLDVSRVVDAIGAKQQAAEANRGSKPEAKPITPEDVVERFFVEHAKVQLNPGHSYGVGGAGHMRMNVATSRRLVDLALNNMAKALARV